MWTSQHSKVNYRIHIGAHKTATTHLQDTLSILKRDLERLNITYLDRPSWRDKLSTFQKKPAYGKVGKFWEKVYFESLMSKTANSKKIVLMSEENMLGRCIDACQINPYQDSSFSRILDFSHASDSLSLFLSLRSTERVFPGSFTTVLRFNPSLAFKIRNQLVESLNLGQRPSWLPLIKRLNREFNKASLSIWNYDQYVNKSSYFIKKVIGQEDLMIPEIQRPQSTQTPSHKAIEMIQARLKIYNSYNSIEWTTMCDDIFCEYPSSQTEERYTFLTPNHIKYCKEQYKDDWEQLQTEESLNCFLI